MLKLCRSFAQSLAALGVIGRLLVVPFADLADEPVADGVVDAQVLQELDRRLIQVAFWVVASASTLAVAGVVDVASLLDLSDEQAVAGVARDQSGICKVVALLVRSAPAGEDVLDALVERSGDEWLVLALVGLAAPGERAGVRRGG